MRDLEHQLDTLNTKPMTDADYKLEMINTIIEIGRRILSMEDKITKLNDKGDAISTDGRDSDLWVKKLND